MPGPIALVGGGEFLAPARPLDAWLLERCGCRRVSILPTAAAGQRPELAVDNARRHFLDLGAEIDAVMILDRDDAEAPSVRRRLATSSFIYIAGGDPRHLAQVLSGTPAWAGVLEANSSGSVLAGSSAGAMVIGSWMLVPGWQHPERGLGLLSDLLVLPHLDRETSSERRGFLERLAALVPDASRPVFRVVGVEESTGLVLASEGGCRVLGAGSVAVYSHGEVLWSGRSHALAERCP